MLYTVELDTAPGLVDLGVFDVSAFAEALEKFGAMDAVASVGGDGSLGFTAQFEARTLLDAVDVAERAVISQLTDDYWMEVALAAVNAYLTPVLEEAQVA